MKKQYTTLEHKLLCLVEQLMEDHEATKDALQYQLSEWEDYDCPPKDANKMLEEHPSEQERREDNPVIVAELTAEMDARHAKDKATLADMG